MIKKLAFALIGLIAALLLVSFLLPSTIHVQRAIMIQAPQCHVFAVLNGFGRFNEWSPWAEIDPEGTVTVLSGPKHGVGSRTEWTSDHPEVGNGSQEITASIPNERIEVALDFEGQSSKAAYLLRPEGDVTEVIWSFDMEAGWNPMLRWLGVLAFDGMLGDDYERGLGALETLLEAEAGADFCDAEIEIIEAAPQRYLVAERSLPVGDHDAVAATLGEAYGALMMTLGMAGAEPTGMPVVITRSMSESTWTFDAALPVGEDLALELDETIGLVDGPVGEAVRLRHLGPYTGLPEASAQLTAWAKAHGFELGLRWERYANDPTTVEPAAIETELYALLR